MVIGDSRSPEQILRDQIRDLKLQLEESRKATATDKTDEYWRERAEAAELQMDGLQKKVDRFDALARKYNYPGSHGPQELRDAFEELRG